MANSIGVENRVGSNSSSLTSSTAAASSFSKSPAAFSSLATNIIPSSSPSSSTSVFQSISSELDGHLKACPGSTATSSTRGAACPGYSAPTTPPHLFSSMFSKWEALQRPTITTSTTPPAALSRSSTLSSTNINSSTRVSSSSHAVACRDHQQNCQYQRRPHHRQRLNSLTIHLTVVLIFATFASLPGLVGSATSGQDENESLVCVKGVSNGFPGVTIPRGDIFIKEGDMLQVYCKLNLTHPNAKGYNASWIDFEFYKSEVSRDQVETRVINETTAMVRVKNMNASSLFMQCVLKPPKGDPVRVCQNQIDVGFPPLEVEDFRCVSQEWKNLNCTWKLPMNPVRTEYAVSHMWNRNTVALCPNTTMTSTSCVWDGRTEPHYRPTQGPIHIRINGTNKLQPSGVIWNYNFSLWSIVIPERPTIDSIVKLTESLYRLNWTFPNFEYFKPGLNHEVSICYFDEDKEKCNAPLNFKTRLGTSSISMTPYLIKNITLPYAYTNFTITVRLRSPDANETEEFWSKPATVTMITDPKAPDFPPEADVASFETFPLSQDLRNVQLYWKSIPNHLKNGPDFNYSIVVYENKSKQLNISPDELTDAYARFNKLKATSSYHFFLTAFNSIGRSNNATEIIVQSVDKLPGEPQIVSKVDFTNGSFDISWKRPGRYYEIVSYTVFRCASNKPRPYPCEGRLEWDRIPAATNQETMHKFYNKLELNSNHQFAVAANTAKYSSGMVWAACTLIHGRVPGKLRRVVYEDPTEDEILIKWNLECAYRPGDIEGFKISYCQVEHSQAENCKDGDIMEMVAVEGAHITTYRLKQLKPNSIYMIYVSILATAGSSPKSDVVYAKTLEGAPSPVTVFNVSRVTNVSAVLGIQSPENWNGILREFKIYYNTSSNEDAGENVRTISIQNSSEGQNEWFREVPFNNLTSNSNYSVSVVVCTSKCSNRSRTFHFRTDVGHTDLSKIFPTIEWADGEMDLQWVMPKHVGGPIKEFQIMLKKNGEPVDDELPTVKYEEGSSSTGTSIRQKCETNTNFTVQVRAVTQLESGDLLFGPWSQRGNYRCGGATSWVYWFILIFLLFGAAILAGFGMVKMYKKLRKINDGLNIKLPPGLNSELNGFAHKQPPRRGSDNDNHLVAYPLQQTSTQLEEAKDFLSSSDLNQGEAEESLMEERNCITAGLLDGLNYSLPTGSICGDSNPPDDDGNDIRLRDFTSIHPDRCSSPSSTYKKLGAQSNGSAVLIEPMPGPSSRSTPSIRSEVSTGDLSMPSPSHNLSQISNGLVHPMLPMSTAATSLPPLTPNALPAAGTNRGVPDVLNSSPSSPVKSLSSPGPVLVPMSSSISAPQAQPTLNHVSQSPPVAPVAALPPAQPPPPVAPAPAPSSTYVKWTTVLPDMKTGDAGGVLENGSRHSPYCQVGILLE